MLFFTAFLLVAESHLCIIDIVHLVKDNPLYVSDNVCALVQHAAQDLCRHDQARSLRLDADISGEKPNLEGQDLFVSLSQGKKGQLFAGQRLD